jgi:hypothetical protein
MVHAEADDACQRVMHAEADDACRSGPNSSASLTHSSASLRTHLVAVPLRSPDSCARQLNFPLQGLHAACVFSLALRGCSGHRFASCSACGFLLLQLLPNHLHAPHRRRLGVARSLGVGLGRYKGSCSSSALTFKNGRASLGSLPTARGQRSGCGHDFQ